MERGWGLRAVAAAWGSALVAADPLPLLPQRPPTILAGDERQGGAVRVTTSRKPPYPWNISLPIRTSGPIRAGDTLQLTYSARMLTTAHETGEAQVDAVVEESTGDHRKLMEYSHSLHRRVVRYLGAVSRRSGQPAFRLRAPGRRDCQPRAREPRARRGPRRTSPHGPTLSGIRGGCGLTRCRPRAARGARAGDDSLAAGPRLLRPRSRDRLAVVTGLAPVAPGVRRTA